MVYRLGHCPCSLLLYLFGVLSAILKCCDGFEDACMQHRRGCHVEVSASSSLLQKRSSLGSTTVVEQLVETQFSTGSHTKNASADHVSDHPLSVRASKPTSVLLEVPKPWGTSVRPSVKRQPQSKQAQAEEAGAKENDEEREETGSREAGSEKGEVAAESNEEGVDYVTGHGEESEESEVAARPLAVMMISTIVIAAVIFAMTHSNNLHLANCTFLAVDNSLCVFIAVLWFQALHEIIELIPNHQHKVLASATHAVCWLLIMVTIAWLVRNRPALLAIIASCGAHIVAFSSTHAAYTLQKHHFSDDWVQCAIGIIALVVCMFLLVVALHLAKRTFFCQPGLINSEKSVNEWHESVEDIENDFWAMAIAVALTELVRFLIVGKYPEMKGVDLHFRHTHQHRMILLAWAVILVVLGCFVVSGLQKIKLRRGLSYPQQRAIGFFSSLIPMLIAWAFLFWGQWHMYEELDFGPIFGRILFADLCSIVALIGLLVLSLPAVSDGKMSGLTNLGIRALSLIVAWSWEQAFDATFEDVLHSWWSKSLVAAGVGVILIPIMVIFVKPITISINEQSG